MGLVEDSTGNTLTYKIIGAAMAVHNRIGPGFKEEIYEKALFYECEKMGLHAARQVPVPVVDEGLEVGLFYLDLLIEGRVLVEVKAFSHVLTNDELAQVINYLKATEAEVALLINFGRRKLDFRRVFPAKDRGTPVQRLGRDTVTKRLERREDEQLTTEDHE